MNAPEFVSQLSGQSEEKIRQVFAGVREKAPAVIFIDELDCIAGKRENASKDMEVRIVAQLASCLDELDGAEARVVVVGVTTRPEYIDQGLRRAGRFEREITLGVPNEEARVQILKVLTRGMRLRPDFPFEEIVKYTPGYVGADLQTLIKEASILAVERAIGCVKLSHPDTQNEESENSLDLDMFYIELDDFKHAAKLVKPSA